MRLSSRPLWPAAVILIAVSVVGCGSGSTCTSTPGRTAGVQIFSPTSAKAGSEAITLTVYGAYFDCGAEVTWNRKTLSSHLVSSTEITATIPASDLAEPTMAVIGVVNPGQTPSAGGIEFIVTAAN